MTATVAKRLPVAAPGSHDAHPVRVPAHTTVDVAIIGAGARALARDYLEGFHAVDLDEASLRALAEQQRAADAIGGTE